MHVSEFRPVFRSGISLRSSAVGGVAAAVAVVLSLSSVLAAGDFSTSHFYQTGTQPYRIAVADLDKDGHPDIVVANCGESYASILWNAGTGTFPAQKKLTTGPNTCPDGAAFGDFNKDGKLDVVVSEYKAGVLAVFLNKGGRTFSAAVKYSVFPATGPIGLAVGDFNKDGKLDIAVDDWGTDSVVLLKGTAAGRFSAASGLNHVGHFPEYILAHDFGGDGKLDVVTGNTGATTLSLLKGKGTGTFSAATSLNVGGAIGGLAMGDFDRDGITDLVALDATNDDVALLIGAPHGAFHHRVTFALGGAFYPAGIAVGDFNGDHFLDVAVGQQYGGTIAFFYGNGQGSLALQSTLYNGGFLPTDVQAAKFNADSKPDLVVANLGVQGTGVAGATVLLNH